MFNLFIGIRITYDYLMAQCITDGHRTRSGCASPDKILSQNLRVTYAKGIRINRYSLNNNVLYFAQTIMPMREAVNGSLIILFKDNNITIY